MIYICIIQSSILFIKVIKQTKDKSPPQNKWISPNILQQLTQLLVTTKWRKVSESICGGLKNSNKIKH